MIFQEFIVTQLMRAGFSQADAVTVFEQNDQLFVQAFTHASFTKENNGSILKMLGDQLISSAFFLQLWKLPEMDQGKMTCALQHIGDLLEKEGRKAGFEQYILMSNDPLKDPIRDTVKAFCGALGVIIKDNPHTSVSTFITKLTDPIETVMTWSSIDCSEISLEKNVGMQLKELWEDIYADKRFKFTKQKMFNIEKTQDGILVRVVDPLLPDKHENKFITEAHGKTEKKAKQRAAEQALKILYKSRSKEINKGREKKKKIQFSNKSGK